MRYNIIGKNIDVWDKTKEMVEKKLDRIEKLFPEDTNATITLSLEKLVSTVEVTIPLNKRLIRAEVQDTDMTAAMDKAVDILENQVVRYKKRMRTKVVRAAKTLWQNIRQLWYLKKIWTKNLCTRSNVSNILK